MKILITLGMLFFGPCFAETFNDVSDPAFIDVGGLLRAKVAAEDMCVKDFSPHFCLRALGACNFSNRVSGENAESRVEPTSEKTDWGNGKIFLQARDLSGKTEANTLYPVTMLAKTLVKLKNLNSFKVDGHSSEGSVQVVDGHLKITALEIQNRFNENSAPTVSGGGDCEFITIKDVGLSFPIYESPNKKKVLGDLLFRGSYVSAQLTFKNGDKSEIDISDLALRHCFAETNFISYLVILDSVNGLHNLGKGPWGDKGWVEVPVVRLTSHDFANRFRFGHREYVEFKPSKVKGKILAISYEGETTSVEVDASSLWRGQKFLPTFMCP